MLRPAGKHIRPFGGPPWSGSPEYHQLHHLQMQILKFLWFVFVICMIRMVTFGGLGSRQVSNSYWKAIIFASVPMYFHVLRIITDRRRWEEYTKQCISTMIGFLIFLCVTFIIDQSSWKTPTHKQCALLNDCLLTLYLDLCTNWSNKLVTSGLIHSYLGSYLSRQS